MTGTWSEWIVTLGRSAELSLVAKATMTVVLGLAVTWMAPRARASVRHLVLASTSMALLVLPLALLVVPSVSIELPVARTGVAATPHDATPVAARSVPRVDAVASPDAPDARGWSMPAWRILFAASWAIGVLWLMASLGSSLWQLARIRREGLPWPQRRALLHTLGHDAGLRRPVELLLHEDLTGPLACGFLRPAIMLPTDACEWSEGDLRRALVHELEHVRRRDWVIQLLAHVTCAVYWFHPLVWIARRHLCLEAERACDDAVIHGAEQTEYAEQLVLLARRLSGSMARPALGMANRSDLSTRVAAILDGTQPRGRVGALGAVAATIGTAVIVLAIAPVRAVGIPTGDAHATASDAANRGNARSRRAQALDRTLYEAAEDGDVEAIAALLDAGANVNAALPSDGSPLIAAARGGRIAAVTLLLDRGADPDMGVPGDGSAIIAAARRGHAEVTAVLLDRGASIDQVVPGDENALIQASGSGHLRVVQLLVERGADVNARVLANQYPGRQGEWRTPLSMARRGRHETVVAYLLSQGARES